ncbi:MAG TPA: diacylglycerol kinase family protein [Anaerolineales bacterium]|nr:diacylglycerol kinase family protein [Anaerolineales bacterium]
MPRKVKLILNPMADMGRAWKAANDLRPIVQEFKGDISWSGTVYPAHAVELAKQAAAEGCDLVIALGGDGTAHEVVNGLMQIPEDQRPVLGVVPLGSGNDFAHALGVPQKPDRALVHALNGQASKIDVGMFTDEHSGRREYFDNTVGAGFDAVVTIRSHKLPIVKGFLMYLTAVIQTILLNHNPAKIQFQTENETWEDSVLMTTICNGGREGGGFLISPESKIDDGVLQFLNVKKVSRGMMFRLVPEFMKGTHLRFPAAQLGDFKKLHMTSDRPLYIHADGEIFTSFGSNVREVSFEVLPSSLKVVRG